MQTSLDFTQELVVDLFAGGGGASTGIAAAYREPDVAVNHDPVAIAVHRANHPNTMHYTCDVFEVDPQLATQGRPVGLLWASPDCRHHSKAKGGKPRSKSVRALAWVVVKWAAVCLPRVIMLENVEEFADWGPLLADGQPCPLRKGFTFRRWVRALEKLGYVVEHRELRACDYGVPTIRKRLYVVARRDGLPIVWPAPTHAKKPTRRLKPYRTAAECIDWSLPCPSIFNRKRGSLKPNSLRRIVKGVCRFTIDADKPFIVPFRGTGADHTSTHDVDAPLSTISSQGTHHGLTVPFLKPRYGERAGQEPRTRAIDEPMATVVRTGNGGDLVTAAIMHITHTGGDRVNRADDPLRTITSANRGEQAIVTAHLEQANTGMVGHDLRTPTSTITEKGCQQRLVTAHLVKYFGSGGQWQDARAPMHTSTTKARMGVVQAVTIAADALTPAQWESARQCALLLQEYAPERFLVDPLQPRPELVLIGNYILVDIGLRMLTARELARAQGFPDSYYLDRGNFDLGAGRRVGWAPVTKTEQVKLIGNSVCPQVATALVAGNLAALIRAYGKQAGARP